MDSRKDFFAQTMDEIVFDNRNKDYGAFVLRGTYQKNLIKALTISVSFFAISLYSPKIVKSLGLFAEKPQEILDTTIVELMDPPSLKPDEPPPPPPPEPVELVRPTERFLELLAVKKEEAIEPPPPTIEELENKDIGNKKVEGVATNEPPPIIDEGVGGEPVVDDKVYVDVDQKAEFFGGEDALRDFLGQVLVYPEAARLNDISGETDVAFVVNSDGKVVDVKVARSSGSSDLDAEAVKAVRKLNGKFRPAKLNGKNVRSHCRIPITFDLEEE